MFSELPSWEFPPFERLLYRVGDPWTVVDDVKPVVFIENPRWSMERAKHAIVAWAGFQPPRTATLN